MLSRWLNIICNVGLQEEVEKISSIGLLAWQNSDKFFIRMYPIRQCGAQIIWMADFLPI